MLIALQNRRREVEALQVEQRLDMGVELDEAQAMAQLGLVVVLQPQLHRALHQKHEQCGAPARQQQAIHR